MTQPLSSYSDAELFAALNQLLEGGRGSAIGDAIDEAAARRPPLAAESEGNWQALNSWYRNQRCDPYPNMARHRLAYLLDWRDDSCWLRLHKAYLSRTAVYQPKADFSLASIAANTRGQRKLPKFIIQSDQRILHQLEQGVATSADGEWFRLHGPAGEGLLAQLMATGRAFWRSCERPPLSLKTLVSAGIERVPEVDHFHLGRFYHDEPYNALIEWLPETGAEPMPCAGALVPRLDVETVMLHFPWQPQHSVELDVGRFVVTQGDRQWSMGDLLRDDHRPSPWVRDQLIHYSRQLLALATVAAAHEAPVAEQFDLGDRLLPTALSALAPLLRQLQLAGWQIAITPRYRLHRRSHHQWFSEVAAGDGGWFGLQLGVELEGQRLNLLPHLVDAIQRGALAHGGEALVIPLEDGRQLQLPGDRVDRIAATLVELFDRQPLDRRGQLRLAEHQLGRLAQLPDSAAQPSRWYGDTGLKEKAEQLAAGAGTAVPVPNNLRAKLRDYQRQGLNWLQFLRRSGLGGVLADDMGLGKTVQVLAHLLLEQGAGRLAGPCLVVAPTSLLTNWASEAARFAPSLRVLVLSGPNRQPLLERLEQYDLVVTSYGTLLRDIERLHHRRFYVLLLDEAQVIKNASSQAARAVGQLTAQHRLCLTGTPLENHLGELWSLFQFLMPGFLGTQSQFNHHYRQPIEKAGDALRHTALVQRAAPFILRRTKSQVATELPPKTEIAELIDLAPEQADLYEAVRLSMAEQVQQAIRQDGSGRNHLLIGNALLRLRQICCHPALIKLESARDIQQSAKLDWLLTMLPEMIEEGRRVLLFSSFTSMLELIASELQTLGVNFLQLTGRSRNRGELVERFQRGDAPVFLISLKAGGAGLNLTAADTVIHFDPWWNPAAEQQASDRAYRLGQDKPVFVYKLIARGTVEERIQQLQQNKRSLADSLYGAAAESGVPLSVEEWLQLLRP